MRSVMSDVQNVAQQAAIERAAAEAGASTDFSQFAGSSLPFGNGQVLLDQSTGAPIAFVNEDNPNRHYLLDDSVSWHTSDQYWGSGYVVTTSGGSQWNTPQVYGITNGLEQQTFALGGAGLALDVTRSSGERLTERYEWRNVSNQPVTITGLGIQTPLNDRYPGARKSLRECVHAHIFAGGDWSWWTAAVRAWG